MQLSLRTLLLLTFVVSMHLALRQWWITTQIPQLEGLVPISLAAFVAIWIGAAKRSVMLAGVFATLAAVASASSLSAETILGSPGTDFLRSHRIDAQYNTDVELNAIAVVILGALAFAGGCVLGFLSKITASALLSETSGKTISGEP